ncbi:hypothetical protein Sango_1043000 [Sesamum angolense]|uniref:Uncharacterized protein n=1 Tax=Sesamum angolense TaxID=2727404 RepID=A0AAE2BZ19_9LAMI|nr:hypothetical protein Sango_1043000 [Sesamum angolense]
MALRASMLKRGAGKAECTLGGIRRLAHALAQPAPLETAITHQINTALPPLVFPENHDYKDPGADFPNLPFIGGAMELMAVPKKKQYCKYKVFLVLCDLIVLIERSVVESSYHISSVVVGLSKILKEMVKTYSSAPYQLVTV